MTWPVPQPPYAPAPPPTARPTTSVIAWIALGLGILGLVLAFVPIVSFGAWVFTLAAFILAIIGLVQAGRAKAVPIISLVLSIVGFVVAVVVSVLTPIAAASNANTNTGIHPGSPPSASAPAADTRVPVTVSGGGDGNSKKVALEGDYAITWTTKGQCYYRATLNGDFTSEVFSASAATSGTGNLYGVPAGQHFVAVTTGPAPSCGWTVTFTPQ